MKSKKLIEIGSRVFFHGGNFAGQSGTVGMIDWDSKDDRAIYGFLHRVKLDSGKYAFVEKSEHFTVIEEKGGRDTMKMIPSEYIECKEVIERLETEITELKLRQASQYAAQVDDN